MEQPFQIADSGLDPVARRIAQIASTDERLDLLAIEPDLARVGGQQPDEVLDHHALARP